MKKDTVDILRWSRQLAAMAISIMIIVVISGCGEADYSSTDYSSGDTGGIAFNVVWKSAPTKHDNQAIFRALDCSAAGVSTVTFEVYDENDQLLKDESFQCAVGSGTVDGVPVGSNRKLAISGKDSNGTVVYYGEETEISVTAGVDTPVGEIICNRVNCTDSDSDSYYVEVDCGILVDCDDGNDLINPEATELCNDTIDNDCDSDIDCDDTDCTGKISCKTPSLAIYDGLIGYFPFDGNANDESGNGNNGTVNGAVLTADRFDSANSAYSFDGIDDYILLGTGLNFVNYMDSLTISAWVYPYEISPAGHQRRYTILADMLLGSSYDFSVQDNSLSFSYWSDSIPISFVGNEGIIENDQWQFVAVTYDGTNVKLYINEELDTIATTSGNIDVQDSAHLIGSSDGTTAFFNGKIDDIHIYKRVLTSDELQVIYSGSDITQECTDADSDTYYIESGCGTLLDCVDSDDTIYPGATEICDDNKDNDCDWATDCADIDCIGDTACSVDPNADYSNSIGMTFNLIPAGTFTMGSPIGENGRGLYEDQHEVTLTQAFYMQTTEVTQGQWEAVMDNQPSTFEFCGKNCPVESVSWNDIQGYIAVLNTMGEGTYRLPTEAEWEYAARAGSLTALPNGDLIEGSGDQYDPNLDAIAWYVYNSSDRTHPVAQKPANAWGLYDIIGNVWERCQDWYWAYPVGPVTDPTGPDSGTERVHRGGNHGDHTDRCRSAAREGSLPDEVASSRGFRLVREP